MNLFLSPQAVGLLLGLGLLWLVVYGFRLVDLRSKAKNPIWRLLLLLLQLLLIIQIESNADFLYSLQAPTPATRVFTLGGTFLTLILCLGYAQPFLLAKIKTSPIILTWPFSWAVNAFTEKVLREDLLMELLTEDYPRGTQWLFRGLGLILMMATLLTWVLFAMFCFLPAFFLFWMGLASFLKVSHGWGFIFLALLALAWRPFFTKMVQPHFQNPSVDRLPLKRKSVFFFLVSYFLYLFCLSPVKDYFHIGEDLFENIIYFIIVYEYPLAVLWVLLSGRIPQNHFLKTRRTS